VSEDTPQRGGLTLRAMVPNAITAAALCAGLTGIRFAITGDFEKSVLAIVLAGMLDGIDGRIARLLKAQSRFGAELDSLADNVSFGVAPALILFLWSLEQLPRLGWFAALAYAIACALRLARFNAGIDLPDEPRKTAGFFTGVPAPAGAGLVLLPIYVWMVADDPALQALVRDPRLVSVWLLGMGLLMISNVATMSWSKLKPRRSMRIEVLFVFGLVAAGLIAEPWWTLIGICAVYLTLLPVGMIAYARTKRLRGAAAAKDAPDAVA
jgi:CDP-diacylglycerol--serine O-phosphatidyltransferase